LVRGARPCNFRPPELVDSGSGADTAPRRLSLIRRHRRWIVHALSAALLFAQLGMAVHASSHLKADSGHGVPAQNQLCGECLSFAPLQNMVGAAPTVILPVKISHDRVLDGIAVACAPQRAFNAFRSRAPPSLV
jgi:hypothetical protein